MFFPGRVGRWHNSGGDQLIYIFKLLESVFNMNIKIRLACKYLKGFSHAIVFLTGAVLFYTIYDLSKKNKQLEEQIDENILYFSPRRYMTPYSKYTKRSYEK